MSAACSSDAVASSGSVAALRDVAQRHTISDLTSRPLAARLDEADALRHLRANFHIPRMSGLPEVDDSLVKGDEDAIYLCGNSLGLLPKATKGFLDEQLDKWAAMGVFGHHVEPVPWINGDEYCVRGVAELVGARESEIALMNGLTVNLHILLTAFYKPRGDRVKIVIEDHAFPSDHYAVESQGEELLHEDDIIDRINTEAHNIALVLLGGVQYYTGQLLDISRVTKAVRGQDIVIGWDLAHAFANVPLSLNEWGVDFACWCSYKYGCTGAGGLAGVFVHERYADDQRDRMEGWWSHRLATRFKMTNCMELDSGANGYRISNPPILLVCAMLGFLKAIEGTSMVQLREKSLLLTGYLEFLIYAHFGSTQSQQRIKVSLITPRERSRRGCQLSLKFNCDIALIYAELVKRGCAIDKRYPDVIRVAPVHLYNSFDDCWRFVSVLRECVALLEADDKLQIR